MAAAKVSVWKQPADFDTISLLVLANNGGYMFDIYLTGDTVPKTDSGVKAVYGRIQIGGDHETFTSSLMRWTRANYERHWIAALRRLTNGGDRSALITSYIDPVADGFLIWWPLYRSGDVIYVQNQMLFFDRLTESFEAGRPWDFVRKREIVNAEGFEISEWRTTIKDIDRCLERKVRAAAGGLN